MLQRRGLPASRPSSDNVYDGISEEAAKHHKFAAEHHGRTKKQRLQQRCAFGPIPEGRQARGQGSGSV